MFKLKIAFSEHFCKYLYIHLNSELLLQLINNLSNECVHAD